MSVATQCTKPRASGSVTRSANARVPSGVPRQASGGDWPAPSQVNLAGMVPPSASERGAGHRGRGGHGTYLASDPGRRARFRTGPVAARPGPGRQARPSCHEPSESATLSGNANEVREVSMDSTGEPAAGVRRGPARRPGVAEARLLHAAGGRGRERREVPGEPGGRGRGAGRPRPRHGLQRHAQRVPQLHRAGARVPALRAPARRPVGGVDGAAVRHLPVRACRAERGGDRRPVRRGPRRRLGLHDAPAVLRLPEGADAAARPRHRVPATLDRAPPRLRLGGGRVRGARDPLPRPGRDLRAAGDRGAGRGGRCGHRRAAGVGTR